MSKIHFLIFILLVLPFSSISAQQLHFKLIPKVSKVVNNNTGATVRATCTIKAPQPKNKIMLNVLQSRGVINKKRIQGGHSTALIVRNNDRIVVSAEPGTAVNLLNLGVAPVQAICSA